MGKISKTFKRVVLSAIATVGLTGIFLGTAFSNFRNAPAEAIVENESSMYDFEYKDNELKLMFNANLGAYKNLNKSSLAQLKNDLLEVAKKAVFDDIQLTKEDGSNTGPLAPAPKRAPAPDSAADILARLLAAQFQSAEDVDNFYDNYEEGGAYDVLTQMYVEHYAEKAGLDAAGKTELKNEVAAAVQAEANKAFEGTGEAAPDVASLVKNSIDATDEPGSVSLDISDVSGVLSIVNDAVKADDTLNVSKILNQVNTESFKEDVKDALVNAAQDNYIEEVTDLLKNVDAEVVGKVINEVGFTSDDMVEVIDNIGAGNLVDIANKIGADNVKEILNNVDGLDKDAIIDSIKSSITVKDVIKAVQAVKVNGEALYDKNNGGFRGRTFINLLRGLPRFSQIRNWKDDSDARLSYNIAIETSLGEVEFKLTVGLFGNINFIKEIAGILDDAFDISYNDGVLNVVVKAPKAVSSLVKRICETDALSDELKIWAYNLIFSTVEDAYNELHNKSLEEYIELLKGVDYEKFVGAAMNADNWNNKLNTNKFTNERIDKIVNAAFKLVSIAANKDYDTFKAYAEKVVPSYDQRDDKIERLFNKLQTLLKKIDAKEIDAAKIRQFADPNDPTYSNETVYGLLDKLSNYEEYYERAQGVFARLFNALPDNVKGKSIMDYYQNVDGERSFKVEGDVNLNIEKIIKAVTPTYGDRIINALASVLDKVPESITLNFEAKFTGLYKITYHYGDEDKVGLLPEGADVAFFGGKEGITDQDNFVKWIYADGTEVEGMPTDDVEVYAVYDYEVNDIEDVEKVYTEQAFVEATTSPEETQWDVTYQWYKVDGNKDVLIEGATGQKFDLTNLTVADSGNYKVVVTEASPDGTGVALERESQVFKVTIKKCPVEEPKLDDSDFPLVYDGTEQTVVLEEESSLYTISNNKQTNAGSYKAKVTLTDKANYEWKAAKNSDDLLLDWEINPAEIAKPAKPSPSEFNYDGTEHKYNITENAAYTVEGNVATDAGEYEAIIRLVNNNYVWKDTDGDRSPLSYPWKINPKKIDKPNPQGASYTWTGNEITYQFAGSQYVTIAGDKGTEVGEYVAVIMLKNGNYVWSDGTDLPVSVKWHIVKAKIQVPANIAWDYTAAFTADGTEKEVKLKSNLPATIEVAYSGNKATEAGNYRATAILSAKDSAHYELEGQTTYSLDWEIKGSSLPPELMSFDSFEKDAQGNPIAKVNVNGGSGIRGDYTLHAPEKGENDNFWKNVDFDAFFDQTEKNGGYIVHVAYDIHFEDTNSATQAVSGNFTVKMLIPENLRGNDNLIVLYISDAGAIEELQSERNGMYMQFNTTHFSVYAIAERTAAPNIPIWPFIVIIALLVVIIILQVIILLRKKAAAAPAEEEKPEEPKEEPQKEEEPQPEPQPEPEPEPEPEEEDEEEEEEEEEEPAVAGEPVLKKKRKKMVPFQRKLAKSEKDLRHKYYDLRDYIKSYGINNRISIPCDTFSLHRKRYVVVTIAGKRLKIYLAADPSKYEGTPIPVEPTKLKKYEDLPTMFKVKSDLSVKRAKLMIDDIMAAEGYERKE